MSIIATVNEKEHDYILPPAGVSNAVVVDVIDLGMVDAVWMGKTTKKHKIRIIWELEEKMDDGKPFTASCRYTLSMHSKATLRKHVEGMRGKKFTEEELAKGFDVERLLGVPCQLVIVHNDSIKDGEKRTFANVETIIKAKVKLAPSGKFIRFKDRKDEDGNIREQPARGVPGPEGMEQDIDPTPADDDIPF